MNPAALDHDTQQPDLFLEPAPAATAPADTTTTSKDAPVLYRCRHCERTTKRPHLWREVFRRTIVRTSRFHPSLARMIDRAEITWTTQDGRQLRGEHPPASACRSCKRPTSGNPVRGRFSAAHRCDARCIYAKGPDCECSCAGANHGAGHSR